MATGLVSLFWCVLAGSFFITRWRPMQLLFLQLPVVSRDIAAAVMNLVSRGIPEAAVTVILVIAAIGAGSTVFSLLKVTIGLRERLTLSLGLGLGILAYLTFLVGAAGALNHWGTIGLIMMIVLLMIPGMRSIAGLLRLAEYKTSQGWADLAFLALLCGTGVFLFSKALKPAVFYDAITYHLGVPNFYLQEGGISYIPYDSCSNFPFAAEMLYLLGLVVYGLKLAQFTSVLVFLLSVLAIREFCRSFVTEVNGSIPAIFFLLTPALFENSILYTNDLHVCYWAFLTTYAFFLWERKKEPGLLMVTGAFAGLSMGTKYLAMTIVFLPAVLAVAYAIVKDKRPGTRAGIKAVMLFSVPALAFYLPWLVKNTIFTGNPFYPAFYPLLGGSDMDPVQYGNIMNLAGHPGIRASLTGLWRHPWNMFVSSPADITSSYGSASYLGPAILLFAPLLTVVKAVDPVIKKLCFGALIMFLFWNFSFTQVRYLYPSIAIMTIVSVYALAKVYAGCPGVFKGLLAAVSGFVLIFGASLGMFMVNTWTAASGFEHANESDDEFLLRRIRLGKGAILDSYPVFRNINETTGCDARVLIIGDAQHLYINRRHLYTYLSGTTPYEVFRNKGDDHRAVHNALREEGVTHIVYSPRELVRLQRSGAISYEEENNRFIEDFLGSRYVRKTMTAGGDEWPVSLYVLR